MSPGSDSDTLWFRAVLSASGDIGKQQYPFSSRFAKAAVMAFVGWLVDLAFGAGVFVCFNR